MKSIFMRGEVNPYGKFFDGTSYLNMLNTENVSVGDVLFEPGCRNHWHVHHAKNGGGQILLCLAGHGWYQEEGKPAQALEAGSVVRIPANVKHWHGAAKDDWFEHIAIEVPGEETKTEWCEPVDEEAYLAL
ncbi:cupin domain-containing protein [uncultured Dubosiella sp.]|uniref:cupin domain-containing protein n=1 Tax=uncultured Dubosiella sp. TaxID=1937011 RepID=UPI0025B5D643|nr:cupin domain-containing protein [uncultured Dubosiella sp.]